ncbi:MAG TPA: pitrilysin family protein [Thermoanaerobaculia bacterium]|jgi:zinc protease|nr:pitrilysin family protein [Thermoanaerobaculia bacterium]
MPALHVDRTAPPAPGELRAFRFPPFVRRVLPGDLTVYAARVAGVPLVSLELVARAGGQHDLISPIPKAGLSTFTASLLDEGSAQRDALEIAAWVERLGGYLYTAADWDSGYVAAALLAEHTAAGLDLLAEVTLTPTFPEKEIERIRSQRLAELLRRAYDPSSQADDKLNEVIYAGTPYAWPLIGREDTVKSLVRDDVVAFYQSHYSLAGSTVIAVGDLDPEELIRGVERTLAPRPGQPPAPEGPEIRPVPLGGITIHIVDRPGASQTELRLGHAGVTRKDPDYLALAILNMLLGGKFTSRINLNLRERHGYTYGASSRFTGRLGPGPFVVDAAVSTVNAGAAAQEVLGELRRIREEPMEPHEMHETVSYMMGVYPYTLQTIGDVAKRLEVLAVYGLPDDYYDGYTERLAAATREQLLAAAQRHIDPERIAIVAVGPADELVPQLEGLGEVTVHRRA